MTIPTLFARSATRIITDFVSKGRHFVDVNKLSLHIGLGKGILSVLLLIILLKLSYVWDKF
jgi:hypothetical protein